MLKRTGGGPRAAHPLQCSTAVTAAQPHSQRHREPRPAAPPARCSIRPAACGVRRPVLPTSEGSAGQLPWPHSQISRQGLRVWERRGAGEGRGGRLLGRVACSRTQPGAAGAARLAHLELQPGLLAGCQRKVDKWWAHSSFDLLNTPRKHAQPTHAPAQGGFGPLGLCGPTGPTSTRCRRATAKLEA